MDNKCVEKLLETVAFSNGCICSVELIQWEHTHFHPSGELQPSKEDINLTRRVELAGDVLGIPLLDHIILGHGEYMSLREEGYMKSEWKGQEEMIQAAEKEWGKRSR